jgi:DtxR family Mn-dependent transcriptional regulator
LHPGLDGRLETSGDEEVVVSSDGGRHVVSRSVAETVSVRADPAPDPRAPLPETLVLSSDRYGR